MSARRTLRPPGADGQRLRTPGAGLAVGYHGRMDAREAERLIAAAVPAGPGTWADLGAGDGTFTRALAVRLGPGARLFAVDRDERALRVLQRQAVRAGTDVTVIRADLDRAADLPGLESGTLDGFLIANTLHFMREAATVLTRLARLLRPDGVAVVIEYDGRRASRWVPYPVGSAELPAWFGAAGLTPPCMVARTASAFGGEMYVAVGRKA